MEKSEALKRLRAIENETKQLRKIIESPNKSGSVFERLNTLEDICIECGTTFELFNEKHKDYEPDTWAYEMLKLICKSFNEEWILNWNDKSQKKWWNWMNMDSSGFGLSITSCFNAYSITILGSLLLFKSEKIAIHVAKHSVFVKVYEQLMVIGVVNFKPKNYEAIKS